MAITIYLVDDHQVVRQGLKALLASEKDFLIVGETGDGLNAIQDVEKLHPNVLVVDLMMPGITGLEVIRQVRQRSPDTRIIVLSMYADEAYVLEALKIGASGYVLKGDSATELVRAVREVEDGHRFLSEPLSETVLDAFLTLAKGQETDPFESLTTREREVLQLSAEGLTSQEIAAQLTISPRTVETHRANMMRKLNLANQTALIRYALKRGILPMDQ